MSMKFQDLYMLNKVNFYIKHNLFYILSYLVLIIFLIFNYYFYTQNKIDNKLLNINPSDYNYEHSNKYLDFSFLYSDNTIYFDKNLQSLYLTNDSKDYEFIYSSNVGVEMLNDLVQDGENIQMVEHDENIYLLNIPTQYNSLLLSIDFFNLINNLQDGSGDFIPFIRYFIHTNYYE